MDVRQPAAGTVTGTHARPLYSITQKLQGFWPGPNRTSLRAQLLPKAGVEKADAAPPAVIGTTGVSSARAAPTEPPAAPSSKDSSETGNLPTQHQAQRARESVETPTSTPDASASNQSEASATGANGPGLDGSSGCSAHLLSASDALQQQQAGANLLVMNPRTQPPGRAPYRQPGRNTGVRISQRAKPAPTSALGATLLQELQATAGAIAGAACTYACTLPGRKHCPTAATMLHLDPPVSSLPERAGLGASISSTVSWRHLRKPSSGPSYTTFVSVGSRPIVTNSTGELLPPPPPLSPLPGDFKGHVDALHKQSCSQQAATDVQQQVLTAAGTCVHGAGAEAQAWPPASTLAYSTSALMKGKAPWRNAAAAPGGMWLHDSCSSGVACSAAAGGGLQAARARRSQESVLQPVASLPVPLNPCTGMDHSGRHSQASSVGSAEGRRRSLL